MTKEEVKKIIEDLVKKYERHFDPPIERVSAPFDPPTPQDWEYLERKFKCSFNPDFMTFMGLTSGYHLPGILNVTREGRTHDNPTLDWSFDDEMSFGRWNADLVPFLSVGNGDYFCVSVSKGTQSGVYYVYHEDGHDEELTGSFEKWLERLEYFLNG